ncbi:LysR family transcriptional regulator [Thioclava sp. GXIMD2076]|uniref:LysR family transcriptional regulator n=1 Tax=Thioclava sp. GXIMD2076 TaxID=3131931 RepID=UPI0030D43B0E
MAGQRTLRDDVLSHMPSRITIRQLEYFLSVCDFGSIAQAAQHCNVSSPSISAAISQLETELGLKLFVRRHAQGLTLSQAGEVFGERVRVILRQVQGLNDLANDLSGKVRGPLRVGCLLTFAQIILPKLRRSFIETYPEIEFHQFERDQAEIFDGLRTARFDVALSYDLDIPSDLDFMPLIDLPLFALFAEDHPLARAPAVTPEELNDHPMVLLDLPLSSEYFLSCFSRHGLRPNVVERTRDIAVMRSLVGNGFGYSLANIRPHSDRSPDGRRLCFVPLAGGPRALRLGLLTSQGAKAQRTVSAFLDHAKALVSQELEPNVVRLPEARFCGAAE